MIKNKTLRNIVNSSLITGSFLLGDLSCERYYNYSNLSPTQKFQEYSENQDEKYIPSLEDFKIVLGRERLEGMTEEDYQKLENFWNNKNNEGRKFFYAVYGDYKEVINKMSDSESIKRAYETFNPYSLSLHELQKHESMIPWRLTPDNLNLREEDKLMLFILDYTHNATLEIKDINIFTGEIILKY